MAKRKVILITSVDVMCNPPKDEVDKQKKVKTNLEIYQESIKKLSEVFDVIDPLKGCEKTVELLSNGPIISYGDQYTVDRFRFKWKEKILFALREDVDPLILLDGSDDSHYPIFEKVVSFCVNNRRKLYGRLSADAVSSDKKLVTAIMEEGKLFRKDEEIVSHFSGELVNLQSFHRESV